jgi:transposase
MSTKHPILGTKRWTTLVTYFTLRRHKTEEEELHLYFEERNEPPQEVGSQEVKSKGFYPSSTVQDFPLRGKSVYLHIRRRKWWLIESKKTITRNWDLVAQGTRMTESFASFLKEVN